MKFDKFTLKAQEALATAQQIAMARSHTVLTAPHLLSAVCSDDDGVVVCESCFGNEDNEVDEEDDAFPELMP